MRFSTSFLLDLRAQGKRQALTLAPDLPRSPYESLLEPERQLYPDLKMQIESETDFKDLPDEEEADLPFDTDLISDFGANTTIDY